MLFWWKEFIVIYLFIACCIQLILLASIGNSRCFEGKIAKQSTWSWLKVVFIDWYQNPTVFSVYFSCKLESVESELHGEEAAAVGARLPVAFCHWPLPWNSINHGALSHANCMLRVAAVARRGGLLVGCYGGPRHGAHMVAPLWPRLLSCPKYSLQKQPRNSCSEKWEEGHCCSVSLLPQHTPQAQVQLPLGLDASCMLLSAGAKVIYFLK